MQPHHPFIADERVAEYSGWDVETAARGDRPPHPHDPFEAHSMGCLTSDELWTAYADTLELALAEALPLARDLPGRTVITADHGNMCGEPGWPLPLSVHGHPRGLRHPELIEVSWATITDDTRPRRRDDGTTTTERDQSVSDRLRDLGYRA